MGLRQVATFVNKENNDRAVVYRNVDWDEYVVRFWRAGTYQKGADYFTGDKQDALETAHSHCKSSAQAVVQATA